MAKQQFRKVLGTSVSSGAIAAMMLTPLVAPAFAQEDPASEDTIVVTGVRSSLQDALEVKRNAEGVSDVITAEDIGVLPAVSIADSLNLITGVQIEEEDGRAVSVGIRGLSSDFSLTTINGREIASTRAQRGVPLNIYPSEIVNRVVVSKSPLASQIEGGVGGTIQLQTPRPLDKKRRTITGALRAEYNELGKDVAGDGWGLRGNISYEDQFMDGKLGIGYHFVGVDGEAPTQVLDNRYFARDVRLRDLNGNGQVDGTVDAMTTNAADQERLLVPQQFFMRQNGREDDRQTHMAIVQYRPTSDMNIDFDFLNSRADIDLNESTMFVNQIVPNANQSFGQEVLEYNINDEYGLVDFVNMRGIPTWYEGNFGTPGGPGLLARANAPRFEADRTFQRIDEETIVTGLNIENDDGVWRTEGDVSYSKSQRERTYSSARLTTGTSFIQIANGLLDCQLADNVSECNGPEPRPGVDVANLPFTQLLWDARGGQFPTVSVEDSFDLTDPNNYLLRSQDIQFEDVQDELFSFRLEAERRFESLGPIKSIEVGLRYADRSRENRQENYGVNAAQGVGNPEFFEDIDPDPTTPLQLVEYPDALDVEPGTFGNFLEDVGRFPSTWVTFNPYQFTDVVFGGEFPFDQNLDNNVFLANQWDVDEETYALYAQADLEGNLGAIPYFGNVGVRAIETNSNVVRPVLNAITTTVTVPLPDGTSQDVLLIDPNVGNSDTLTPEELFNNLVFQTVDNSYTDVLPTLNLAFELTDDVLLRLGAGRVLTRPGLNELGSGSSIRNGVLFDRSGDGLITAADYPVGVNPGTAGNPLLEPFRANQFDASLEWYVNRDTAVSIAYFYKDIEQFIQGGRTLNQTFVGQGGTITDQTDVIGVDANGDETAGPNGVPDVLDQLINLSDDGEFNIGAGGVNIDLTGSGSGTSYSVPIQSFEQGEGGVIQGIEFSWQQSLDFLPGLLQHTGFLVNYTHLENDLTEVLGGVEDINDVNGNDLEIDGNPNVNGNGVCDAAERAANACTRNDEILVKRVGFSDNTANAQYYFDNGPFSLRLIYNWRDAFNTDRRDVSRRAARGQLNFTGRYRVNDSLALTLQAFDLTNEAFEEYNILPQDDLNLTGSPDYDKVLPSWYQNSGTRYFLSVNFRL